MNDANTPNDRKAAAAIWRRAVAKGLPIPWRKVLRDCTGTARVRYLSGILLIVAFPTIAACSGTPEQRAYDIADRRAEWLDRLSVDKRACATLGGVIVQERHQSDSIRLGGPGPEIGTTYYCRY
jgi:hypothetical protein